MYNSENGWKVQKAHKAGCGLATLAMLIVVLLMILLPALALADSPEWKLVSGPPVPGAHSHSFWVNHVWVRDGWSGAVYTCHVNWRTYLGVRRGDITWLNCWGHYGKS